MTYLGTIATAANSSVNNTNTATPFTIPSNAPRLLIVTPTDASGDGYNVRVGTGSALAAGTNDFNVAGSSSVQIQCPIADPNATVIAIFVAAGGSAGNVKVYAIYGPASS